MSRLVTTLKFGEWLPDLPEIDNPGSPNISNALWVNGGYIPAPGFSGLGASLSARCQGACAATDAGGNTHIYAGTGSQLLEYTGTSFADRSGASYTTQDGQYWKFAEFSSPSYPALLVATNLNDPVQAMPVGNAAFAALAGTPPKAAAVGVVGQFVMLGNTEDAVNGVVPNRVQWCGIANPTNWVYGTLSAQQAQAGQQYLNAIYGPVTHIADGTQFGLIFQQRGITRAYYTGDDAIFAFDTFEKQRGAHYPNSPVQLGNLTYFVAEDGFCVTDGAQVMQIGHGKVDNSFLSNVSQAYSDRVCGAYDPVNKLIYWSYCSAGNSTGIPDTAIAYNYADQRFMSVAQALSRIFTSKGPGYSMDTLDNVNLNLDLISPSLDDPYWQGGDLQIQAFDAGNNYGALGGGALNAVLDTTEACPNPGGVTYLDGARPVTTNPSGGTAAPTVQFLTRALENSGYAASAVAAQNASTGICNVRATGRYIRARLSLAGGAAGFGKATGVDIYGVGAGQR